MPIPSFRACLQPLAVAALFASPAWSASAPAPSGNYVSDPAHSSVLWKVNHLGLSNYTARFTKMTAELDWKADQPEQSRIVATIDPTSVRTDFPFPDKEDFDKKIGTSEPFLAGKPISFTSTSVKITGTDQGIVTGDLTLRGETHPATIAVTFNGSMAEQPMEKSPKIGFSGILKFKRSEWGLAPKIKSAGEDVTVVIETEFQPAPAARQ